jgi:hypothetical protein
MPNDPKFLNLLNSRKYTSGKSRLLVEDAMTIFTSLSNQIAALPLLQNIYTADGTLASNRIVTGNGRSLQISGLTSFTVAGSQAHSILATNSLRSSSVTVDPIAPRVTTSTLNGAVSGITTVEPSLIRHRVLNGANTARLDVTSTQVRAEAGSGNVVVENNTAALTAGVVSPSTANSQVYLTNLDATNVVFDVSGYSQMYIQPLSVLLSTNPGSVVENAMEMKSTGVELKSKTGDILIEGTSVTSDVMLKGGDVLIEAAVANNTRGVTLSKHSGTGMSSELVLLQDSVVISSTDGTATGTVEMEDSGTVSISCDDGANRVQLALSGNGTNAHANLIVVGNADLQINGSAGTAGQLIRSNGANAAPTWVNAPIGIVSSGSATLVNGVLILNDSAVTSTCKIILTPTNLNGTVISGTLREMRSSRVNGVSCLIHSYVTGGTTLAVTDQSTFNYIILA